MIRLRPKRLDKKTEYFDRLWRHIHKAKHLAKIPYLRFALILQLEGLLIRCGRHSQVPHITCQIIARWWRSGGIGSSLALIGAIAHRFQAIAFRGRHGCKIEPKIWAAVSSFRTVGWRKIVQSKEAAAHILNSTAKSSVNKWGGGEWKDKLPNWKKNRMVGQITSAEWTCARRENILWKRLTISR